MAILDSSAIIDLLAANEKGKRIKEKYEKDIQATTQFSLHEVLVGLIGARREVGRVLINQLEVFDYDRDAAEKSIEIEEKLRKKGRLINQTDIFIAGICMAKNMAIITTDEDFKEIDGLKVLMP